MQFEQMPHSVPPDFSRTSSHLLGSADSEYEVFDGEVDCFFCYTMYCGLVFEESYTFGDLQSYFNFDDRVQELMNRWIFFEAHFEAWWPYADISANHPPTA
ncbi:MAG: hypothetical protein M3Q81_03500 [bacterium]|nr:hypothetical protein [bacterium]